MTIDMFVCAPCGTVMTSPRRLTFAYVSRLYSQGFIPTTKHNFLKDDMSNREERHWRQACKMSTELESPIHLFCQFHVIPKHKPITHVSSLAVCKAFMQLHGTNTNCADVWFGIVFAMHSTAKVMYQAREMIFAFMAKRNQHR